ncbi:MAG: type II toxin-antitoxin system prevent-host-death family antitoxin [Chloroflexi bacterium]|nr:type II toxin-antitoxin system prevent-host-death family antitoxin [Chloroflexota bacterium]
MQRVHLKEAQLELAALLEAAINGETVLIVAENEQMVQLVPLEPHPQQRIFGSAAGTITMSDDFDEPLEDFREYME